MKLQNWDARSLSLEAWRALLAKNLGASSAFELHCWNEEIPWITLALQYGERKPSSWEWGTVIQGAVTPAFRRMFLTLDPPADQEPHRKFTPFFSLFLSNGFCCEHYGTELTQR